jgi:DNA polymerase IV
MILHIDMDAFYASVEIRDNPRLAQLPVVVGGSADGRGVVSTANYLARKFGIHSAMPAAQAKRLCPQAVFIRPRMAHYAAVSQQIRGIFHSFTDLVEPLSLDEAFIDVTGSQALFGDAVSIARRIKQRIRDEVGLTASAGVAPNKYLAKVASDLEKPDGLVVVDPAAIHSFLDPLPVSRVWGVGAQTQKKLEALGAHTIGQLRALPLEILKLSFGVNSEHFWRLARGLDTRAVVPDRDAHSISHETTFSVDISDAEALRAWLLDLTDDVARRLRHYQLVGRTVQLKLRYSNFETITRSRTLAEPTHVTEVIARVASELFLANSRDIQRGIRLIGVGVSQLGTKGPVQLSLFDQPATEKSKRIDKALDEIRDKFGKLALSRGSSLRTKKNQS